MRGRTTRRLELPRISIFFSYQVSAGVLLLVAGVAASVAPEAAASAGLNALRATIMLLTAAFDAGVWLAPKVAAASRSLGEATLLLIHLATTWISALVSPYATAI